MEIVTLTSAVPRKGAASRLEAVRPQDSERPASDALKTVLASLEDAKAEDITVIDITGKSALCDQLIVASGRSHRHVGAIADRVMSDYKDAGFGSLKAQGLPHCDWVLIDAGDFVVHIFRPEVRSFYNIEKLWTADLPLTRPQA